jgi:PKD domain/Domain of unknown function (DUF1735)
MKNIIRQGLKRGLRLSAIALVVLAASCKYENVVPGTYPDAATYLPAAVGGIYNINAVAATGAVRYAVDVNSKKLNIPLSVVRSGLSASGDLSANLVANTDTITKMIAAGRLPDTELLPAANYSLPPSVTSGGKDFASFNLSLNLDFLRANATKKYAIGVTIVDATTGVNPSLKTAIIVVDAKILKPTANFTTKIEGKKVTFTNASTFATNYSWNFGNNSPASSATQPIYTYPNSGTYTVTLTATGITGSLDAATRTMSVVIP